MRSKKARTGKYKVSTRVNRRGPGSTWWVHGAKVKDWEVHGGHAGEKTRTEKYKA